MELFDCAALVAAEFKADMDEHNCETFEELKRCYRWTPGEIKDEIDFIVRNTEWYVDEGDRKTINNLKTQEYVLYKDFMALVKKIIKLKKECEKC